jgi:hypothetical protein
MKEELLKTEIEREKGWLYFCGTSADGKIIIERSKMGKNKSDERRY